VPDRPQTVGSGGRHPPPLTIFTGTKAQFLKLAPVAMEFDRRGWPYRIIDTGQHGELMRPIIERFHLRQPDHHLAPGERGVDTLAGGLRWIVRVLRILARSPRRLRDDLFDGGGGLCLVHGDTASTLLSALISWRAGQQIVHVEAGLRSHRFLHPFPEEIIRIIVMRMSALLFAPSPQAFRNLETMGLAGRSYMLPGNTNLDTLALDLGRGSVAPPDLPKNYAVITIHRLETLYSRRRLALVMRFVLEAQSRTPVLFVCHPPTEKRLRRSGLWSRLQASGIRFLPLMDHGSFVHLIRDAQFIFTDGGSVQEEAAFLGTPCLLLRRATERDDGLERNVVLSGLREEVLREFLDHLENYRGVGRTRGFESPSAAIADRIALLQGDGSGEPAREPS
jgi:UDP-N-acetylglucosamine 2-epimerase